MSLLHGVPYAPVSPRQAGRPRRRATDAVVGGSIGPQPLRRETDGWLERWMETVADLARLKRSHPMLDAVIEEQDGRRIRIGDRWLFDFASCNYLGFDLDPEIIAAVPEYLARWGTHPSWSRLLGSPVLYEEIEAKVTELVGGEDTLLFPTITHIHMSVIPVLAGRGHDLPGRPGAQDDLRRRDDRARTRRDGPTLPARRPGASRGAAPGERDHAPRDRARRRELDARQRSGPARVRTTGARVRRPALRRRCPRLRRRRRALAGRALRLGHPRERHHPSPGRDLRERDLRRRLLEGVLVAPVVPHAAHAAEGRAEGGGASVPLLRTVAGGVARHGDRGPGRERPAGRSPAPRDAPQDRPGPGSRSTSSASTRRTARGTR